MNKNEFINSIREGAVKGRKEYGILPSMTIAQAILESGWGTSELSRRANNLFGVKAFSDWKGGRITMATTEWYGGQRQEVYSDFRVYDSLSGSIEDHNRLLAGSRYNSVRECDRYREACRRIYECGYATDPEYSEKLIRLIEENRLYEFDIEQKPVASDFLSNERIRKFQHLCNELNIRDSEGRRLVEDSILGPRTRSCLKNMPVLRIGESGPAVEFVQEAVQAEPVDGDFGPITRGCVEAFQRDRHIEVDGIVGVQTWTAILTA